MACHLADAARVDEIIKRRPGEKSSIATTISRYGKKPDRGADMAEATREGGTTSVVKALGSVALIDRKKCVPMLSLVDALDWWRCGIALRRRPATLSVARADEPETRGNIAVAILRPSRAPSNGGHRGDAPALATRW